MTDDEMRGELSNRVRRGAALLDQVEAGWWRRIDVDTLAMETCDQCILGQLHGFYFKGFREVLRRTPSHLSFRAAAHGFTLLFAEQCEGGREKFALLTLLWRDQIRMRRRCDAGKGRA